MILKKEDILRVYFKGYSVDLTVGDKYLVNWIDEDGIEYEEELTYFKDFWNSGIQFEETYLYNSQIIGISEI